MVWVVVQVLGVFFLCYFCGIELVEQGGNIFGVGVVIFFGWSIWFGERYCLIVIVIVFEFFVGVGMDN